ncbi:hypothetical protein SDC9_49763 [bioreactor metagenome]|uniref:Uncharacterized protein n=1 Tax=bioreactor metagenome TaxID=1076179 RepID=A0A644WI00_9ZZZZ
MGEGRKTHNGRLEGITPPAGAKSRRGEPEQPLPPRSAGLLSTGLPGEALLPVQSTPAPVFPTEAAGRVFFRH